MGDDGRPGNWLVRCARRICAGRADKRRAGTRQLRYLGEGTTLPGGNATAAECVLPAGGRRTSEARHTEGFAQWLPGFPQRPAQESRAVRYQRGVAGRDGGNGRGGGLARI